MKFCLGTVQFGTDYGIQGAVKPGEENVDEILGYAIKHNLLSFDTAPAYGNAESILGGYIKNNPDLADRVSVVTKLSAGAFDGRAEKSWAGYAVACAKESLARLGVKRLGGYLLHDAGLVFHPQAVKAVYAVKEAGLAGAAGVSAYTPDEAMKALEYPEITAIQIPYNVFDRRLDKCGFFEKAMAKKVHVYARSTLLQGLATMDPDALPDRVSFAKGYLAAYRSVCEKFSVSPLAAAVGYVSAKKGVEYMVFGVDSLGQLKQYIMLRDTALPDGMADLLDREFADVEERLVNPVLWR